MTEIMERMEEKELLKLLSDHKYAQIREIMENENAVDIAEFMGEIPPEFLLKFFRVLPKDMAADVFAEMDPEEQEVLINGFTDRELKDVLDDMYLDDTVDMLEEMPANVVNRVLAKADSETRKQINELLKYPEDSAGAVMTTEYMRLRKDLKVPEAVAWIRKRGEDCADLYNCFVTDANRQLLGTITLRELLLAGDERTVESLMDENVISVKTLDDKETAAKLFDRYEITTLPVTDQEDRMVGIITIDDAIDVLQEENTEDMVKMAAVAPAGETYFDTGILHHVKNRIPWLFVLMFSSMMTGIIIEHYEGAFQAAPLLVALMPMLMDTGGNCGTQASTLIIRGMALDEIRPRDFFKVFWTEFRVSGMVGAALAVANGVRIYLQYRDPSLALVIAFTLLFVVMVAKLLGCCLPMLVKRLHLDPALVASPLLTTFVDICSVTIYFTIATHIMHV